MTDRKNKVFVRPMSIDDLSSVYHLGAKLFTAGTFPSLYRTWDEFELVGFFESDWDTCFVATDDEDALIGFVLGTVLEKRRSAWSYGWVVWIGVDPEAARGGVASKLLERVTEAFRELGCRILLADTDPANEKAVRFFEKHGFGNPREHVYLEKNLSTKRGASKKPKKRGPGRVKPPPVRE
ncbi:MAG: GNAT family N-acetyltransferase [Myxococcota bacterium]|nr:GNAT family N-acetyltransferase [Myxococcota bacterium]